jgi:hypothetical protein
VWEGGERELAPYPIAASLWILPTILFLFVVFRGSSPMMRALLVRGDT